MSSQAPRKTVLITGCSYGGIGSSLATAFHARGLHVIATARSLSSLSHLENTPNITLLQLDVTSDESVSSAVEALTSQTGGRLDYLVNNAGALYVMPILDTDLSKARSMFEVNLWGVLRVTQAFAPLLIRSQGTVVNICSVTGHMNVPWGGCYGASKGAIESISETLLLELKPLGVKVVSVVTGTVESKIWDKIPDRFELPEGSVYKGVEDTIARRAKGEGIGKNMDVDQYAKNVVADVLGGKTGRLWRGTSATLVWATNIVPQSIMNRLLIKGTGLDNFVAAKKEN